VREAGVAVETLDNDQPSYAPMVARVLADFAAGRPAFATLDASAATTTLCDRIYAAAAT